MITAILGLAGSGALGSLFGLVSDFVQGLRTQKLEEARLKTLQEARLHGQKIKDVQEYDLVSGRMFDIAFVMLTATTCICCILCLWWPDVELLTFDPSNEPRKFSFLWGLIDVNWNSTKVYRISTGGVALGLLHATTFQICAVITAINPMRRR